MLRIALPNKGSLSGPAAEMLHEAGYRQRKDPKELVLVDPDNGVEFFYLRPRDIAIYVGSGRLDVGITGRDLLLDSGANGRGGARRSASAGSTFRFAAPARLAHGRPGPQRPADRHLVRRHRAQHLGRARRPADVIRARRRGRDRDPARRRRRDRRRGGDRHHAAPGRAGDLRRADPELRGRASSAATGAGPDARGRPVHAPARRASWSPARYVMMDYDIRAERRARRVALTPGLESPTVSPLHSEGWVAVRAMVPRKEAQRIMDDL